MSLGLDVRNAFLQTLARAADVLAAPEVAAAWDQESVLARFTVRGLAGHLARAGTLVEEYLGAGIPEGCHPVDDAAQYYERAALPPDVDDSRNTSIRERGEAEAEVGYPTLLADFVAARERLGARLATEPADAFVAVGVAMVLPLDQYLVTRIIELTVHADDLAASVGIPVPEPDPVAATLAIHALVSLARRRHGDGAVIRALTRRERDVMDALRAF